jgi:hypothetical protein
VLLLSLRLRKKQGPTLPSRLVGAAEDGLLLLLVSLLDALLDNLRIKLPLLPGGTIGVVLVLVPVPVPVALADTLLLLVSSGSASAIGLVLLTQLRPREMLLALWVKIESGS